MYTMYYFSIDWLQKPHSSYSTFEAILSCNCMSVALYFASVMYSYFRSKILNTANL